MLGDNRPQSAAAGIERFPRPPWTRSRRGAGPPWTRSRRGAGPPLVPRSRAALDSIPPRGPAALDSIPPRSRAAARAEEPGRPGLDRAEEPGRPGLDPAEGPGRRSCRGAGPPWTRSCRGAGPRWTRSRRGAGPPWTRSRPRTWQPAPPDRRNPSYPPYMATPTVETRNPCHRCAAAWPPTGETRRSKLSTTTSSRHVTTNHKIWGHLTLDAFGADTTPVRGNVAAPDVETIGDSRRQPLRGNQR